MTDPLTPLPDGFNQWLARTVEDDSIVGRLAALAPAEMQRFVSGFPRPARIEITKKIIERAHWLLSRSPKSAEPVARLAVLFAKLIVQPGESGQSDVIDAAVDLEADISP